MQHLSLKVVFLSLSSFFIFIAAAIGVSTPATAEEKTVPYGNYRVAPEVLIYPYPATKSQFLWGADSPIEKRSITNKIQCFFRYKLHIPEPIKKAFLNISYDDFGQLFVNGKPCPKTEFQRYLKPGNNVLGFTLRNNWGPTALIFYGEIELASGKIIYVHSTPETVKSTSKVYPNWAQPQFDDSTWNFARSQGDATAAPWAKFYNYVSKYATSQEKKIIAAAKIKALFIPNEKALEQEPDQSASIVFRGRTPDIVVNGRTYPPVIHVYDSASHIGPFQDNVTLKLHKIGIKIFEIRVSSWNFYRGLNNYDFSRCETQIRRILHFIPDALFIIRFNTAGNMKRWCDANPDETIAYANGPVDLKARDEFTQRALMPSAASDKFSSEVKNQLRSFVNYFKNHSWGKRIIGIRLGYGVYGEWHTYGMYNGPDTGKRMTEKFRQYLTKKYQTDAKLQQAWNQPGVTLKTATVPDKNSRGKAGTLLLDPTINRQAIDYFDCNAQVNADFLLDLAQTTKNLLPNKLVGAFYGYIFSSSSPEGTNLLMDKVLSSPYIDFLSDPIAYTARSRRAGGDGDHRAVPYSFRRYRKLAVLEDDTRFHQNYVDRYYATKTPRESRMVARRNFCNMLFDGSGLQIFDPEGVGARPHYFDNPSALQGIAETWKILEKLRHNPACPLLMQQYNDTAVVVSYMDMLRFANRHSHTELSMDLHQRVKHYLYHSGVAFDLMTLQDFLVSKHNYKVVIFLNLFSPSPAERQAVLARVRRPGVSTIWLVGPGGVTAQGFSNEAMSELVGIKLKGIAPMPRVYCADIEAKIALPGVVYKKLPDNSTTIFSAKIPNCGTQWQKILKFAGSRIYTNPENYFRRVGSLYMLHTGKPGTYTLKLDSDGQYIEEFSGQKFKGPDITVNTTGPDTWLFRKIN